MSELSRRGFLATLAFTTLAGVGAARAVLTGSDIPQSAVSNTAGVAAAAPPRVQVPGIPQLLGPPSAGARIPLPGHGVLNVLPGAGDMLALTLDDGVNSDVVRLYTEFAKDTGVRLTYFVNGVNRSWTDNAPLLRPLVDAAQIQLGNHTWSHPDLTKATTGQIRDEIAHNDTFLRKMYGVRAAPYLRPPYGFHNAHVDTVAADLGYTAITMWSGSLSDSTVITEDCIVAMARKYFAPQSIVIGHLNHLPVTHVYGRLVDIIRARNLRTVTLDDVFTSPGTRPSVH